MKRIYILLITMLAYLPFYGISTSGEWIPLEGGLNAYPACISLSVLDDNEKHINVVNILIISNEEQQIKESNTKALLKLSDGFILELDSYGKADSSYYPQIHFGNKYDLYKSWQSYIIGDEDLDKLLTLPVVKVRVEQRSGDRRDIEVSKKQGKKVLKELNKSWSNINNRQDQRIQNANTDIKSDF